MEDTISIYQLDTEFVIFMQTPASGNNWSVATQLYGVATDWHEKKEKKPSSLDQPMRTVLLYCLLNSLLTKVQELETNVELNQQCSAKGLIEGTTYPTFGRTESEARAGHSGGSGPPRPGGVPSDRPAPSVLSQRGGPLPSAPPHDRKPGGGRPAFHLADSEQERREPKDAYDHGSLGSQCLLASGGLHDAPVPAGSLPPSQADRQTDQGVLSVLPAHLLQLTLYNTCNYCYSHAVLMAILWTASSIPTGMRLYRSDFIRVLRWLTRKPQHLHLWQLRAWTAFCSEWQEPHLQHDAAEFLQHLAPALHSSTSLGWEARLGVDGEAFAQVVDQGQLFPLVLHSALDPALQSRNTPVSLQKLLISWRNQVHPHAAVTEPEWLAVQLNRVGADGQKTFHPLSLHPTVYIPRFVGRGTRSTSSRFLLVAIVYHLGATKLSGHYRTALLTDGSLRHVTDDNIVPQPVTNADISDISRNAYLCFLKRA